MYCICLFIGVAMLQIIKKQFLGPYDGDLFKTERAVLIHFWMTVLLSKQKASEYSVS
jgi:hypothetical protein